MKVTEFVVELSGGHLADVECTNAIQNVACIKK
jgi:hypothetical protein